MSPLDARLDFEYDDISGSALGVLADPLAMSMSRVEIREADQHEGHNSVELHNGVIEAAMATWQADQASTAGKKICARLTKANKKVSDK